MKNVMKNKSMVLLGSLAGTCLMGTVAFANPSMLPDHPGYPMKGSKSPVTDVPTANDPGQENLYGQEALSAATEEYTQDLKLRRGAGLEEATQSEGQDRMGDQSQRGGQDQMGDQPQMGGQNQMKGQEHMTREKPTSKKTN